MSRPTNRTQAAATHQAGGRCPGTVWHTQSATKTLVLSRDEALRAWPEDCFGPVRGLLMRSMNSVLRTSFAYLVPPLLLACGGGGTSRTTPQSEPDNGYFESAASSQGGPGRNGGGGATSAGDLAAVPGAPADGNAAEEATREIAEADVIQLQGSKLYAMSRSGGLSVI